MPEFLNLLPNWVWTSFAAVLGACIGSFLNVAIYRLPRGLSVNKPRHSYCPSCEAQIPWYRNLPILTWLMQGGKAACCGERIPVRYVLIELITAAFFALAWLYFSWPLALALMPFLALLILGSAIDLEHMLLPDVTTLGGLLLGLLASALLPQLHGFAPNLSQWWWPSLKEALLGAGIGFALMISVWQLGKWAFGRQKIHLTEATPFALSRNKSQENSLQLSLGQGEEQESLPWAEIFSRKSDRVLIEASEWNLQLANSEQEIQTQEPSTLELSQTELKKNKQPASYELSKLAAIAGKTKYLVLPREAMGFGDVLLVAMLGAWCGWQGALFSLGAGALLGLLLAIPARLLKNKQGEQTPLPFGPFLAAAGVIWLFGADEWLSLYGQSLLTPLP